MSDQPADLVRRTVAFCRLLRRHGLHVTTARALDAVRALERLDLGDAQEVRLGLRTVLTSRPDDLPVFDGAFDLFWFGLSESSAGLAGLRPIELPRHARARLSPPRPGAGLSLDAWADRGQDAAGDPIATPAMSDRESLAGRDFATFSDDQLDDLLRVAVTLARRLETRIRRRWRAGPKGRLDFRRTVRGNLARDEWIQLFRRRRRRRPLRLVVLCDVSGSMDLYSRVLLLFMFALQQAFGRIESFSFSTRLTRITGHLKGRDYRAALARLTAVGDWSGGTRIGESLGAFNRRFGALVDRQTLVIILSDGWDTGDPEVLARELRRIRRRARGLIWLNPLLGHAGYAPETRGMAAALPCLDRFAPAHNLRSLANFANGLV